MRHELLRRALALSLVLAWPLGTAPPALAATADGQPPLLAYYYIWYDATSWDRAKNDYPLRGHYSSDQELVMRDHIELAKKAGIDGFIVSWKSTEELNRRLDSLVQIAEQEDFKLALIYQGLNFERNPQTSASVAHDLAYFRDRWAASPAFDIFAKPLVIWSGTWEFTRDEVKRVTDRLGSDLLILATEKNRADYVAKADVVDGDAYYWSSVNPHTYPDYPGKLIEMSRAVDRHDGLWIAPAAPGFDARLIGGTSVVPRRDGATLREEYEGAIASAPDAVGLISWNEFSENTQVEPSKDFGYTYVRVVADIRGATLHVGQDFDSSEPAGPPAGPGRLILLGAALLGSLVLVGAIGARRRS